jgi:hypothetical protein
MFPAWDSRALWTQIVSAEPENDSSAEPEVILPVVEPIGDFCQEVFSLHRANREVPGDFDVNSPTRRHCEMALPSNLFDPGACRYASEKDLSERRNPAVPEA